MLLTILALFNVIFGLLYIRNERRLERAFRRLRFLHERLETVEKLNGVSQTFTDVRAGR